MMLVDADVADERAVQIASLVLERLNNMFDTEQTPVAIHINPADIREMTGYTFTNRLMWGLPVISDKRAPVSQPIVIGK